MRIASIDEITKKWGRRSAAATQDLEAGIKAPRRPWKASTLAAAQAYADGVQAAIANNQFSRGVEDSSDDEWRSRALTLGVPRYSQGVQASTARYGRGFAPYHSAISAMELPPRGPRGSAANYDRVRLIGETLNRIRTGQTPGI